MSPALYPRTANDAFDAQLDSPPESREAATTGTTMEPWLIIVIVVGALILTSLFVFLLIHFTRKRRRTVHHVYQDPFGRKDRHRRNMSETDRQAAEEIERAAMIRKSLASRTSSWGGNSLRYSGISDYQMDEFGRQSQEEHQPMAPMMPPRENWKELEAGTQGSGVTPGVHNTEMGIHPALLPQPQLAFPQPSRGPSPNRGPQPPRLIIPS
ncbi:uncharacterized protein GGS22DRAFT_169082 [Annulohypoxylon maeteangense]|uniref:uncharacterized protein n=1 Tax=Annulohypoxylon maeteangense TaxID=1927788 RepID=UPI0020080E8F|nr:uncharacterized protein GGS22DRAFT_169082 [Annulohypoxylon maeteangense]KAI0882923.1 hypothetical protein GGS22DRAFT_169082 [Annulohypoxylon maeteangense]